jgi:hypothetical protein
MTEDTNGQVHCSDCKSTGFKVIQRLLYVLDHLGDGDCY